MDYNTLLTILVFILGVGLIAIILLQQSDSGLYGQESNINRTRRGTEKSLFNLTIVLGSLFMIAAIISFFIS